jgi:hypothetical protein
MATDRGRILMSMKRVTILLGLLFVAGVILEINLSEEVQASGNCGFVTVDCTTSKIPVSLIPPTVVALPNSIKTLVTTATNTITSTDICTSTVAAGVCPLTGTDSKLSTSIMPDLSSSYIPTAQKGAASGVASLGTDTRLVQYPSGAAPVYFNPATPSSLTSTSFLMFGLGSTIHITPTKSGKVRLTISFYPVGVGPGLNSYKISYGSGTVPANGAAATGTVVGGVYTGGITITGIDGGISTPALIDRNVVVMSLTPLTAYWFDVQGSKSPVNTSMSMNTIEASLEELPY